MATYKMLRFYPRFAELLACHRGALRIPRNLLCKSTVLEGIMLRNRSPDFSNSLIMNRLTGSHIAQPETLRAELAPLCNLTTLLPAGTEIRKIREQWTRPHTLH